MKTPRDLADRMRDRYLHETFTLSHDAAQVWARWTLARYPKETHGTAIERW